MNTISRAASLALLLPAAASAQIPRDHALVLLLPPTIQDDAFRIVDTRPGGGTSLVRDQRVFASFESVAVDPVDGGFAFFSTLRGSFPGAWEMVLENETIRQSRWGAWQRNGAVRVEVGVDFVITLGSGGDVVATPRAGGPERTLTSGARYIDVDIAGATVFALDGTSGRVDAIDANTAAIRTVGSYSSPSALGAVDATRLFLGTANGDLLEVDVASGAVLNLLSPRVGRVIAVAATSTGVPVFATGGAVYTALDVARPLLTTSVPILDLDVARTGLPTVVRFGGGCAGTPNRLRFGVDGPPRLGNQHFAAPLAGGQANAPAVLAIGGSRQFAASLNAALPLALTPFGGGDGCELLVDPAVRIGTALDASGAARIPLPVPADPALRGQLLFAQWLTVERGRGAPQLVNSDAATWALW